MPLVAHRWIWLVAASWAAPAWAGSPMEDRVETVLNARGFEGAHWGLLVVEASTGRTVFERNADRMFCPASVTKLFSTAAAMADLGADRRFKTPVVRRGEIKDGTLRGDLILVAKGTWSLGGRTGPDRTPPLRGQRPLLCRRKPGRDPRPGRPPGRAHPHGPGGPFGGDQVDRRRRPRGRPPVRARPEHRERPVEGLADRDQRQRRRRPGHAGRQAGRAGAGPARPRDAVRHGRRAGRDHGRRRGLGDGRGRRPPAVHGPRPGPGGPQAGPPGLRDRGTRRLRPRPAHRDPPEPGREGRPRSPLERTPTAAACLPRPRSPPCRSWPSTTRRPSASTSR